VTAGLGIRLFTDEMIDPLLAEILGAQGYDVESTEAAGRANQRIHDEPQLEYATQQGRAILTFNARDFIAIDRKWKAAGTVHAGIIVSEQITNVYRLAHRVKAHLETISPSVQANTLLYLLPEP
jgi:hypothetical protein